MELLIHCNRKCLALWSQSDKNTVSRRKQRTPIVVGVQAVHLVVEPFNPERCRPEAYRRFIGAVTVLVAYNR